MALWPEAGSEKVTSVFKFEALGYRDGALGKDPANGETSLASFRNKRKRGRKWAREKSRMQSAGP